MVMVSGLLGACGGGGSGTTTTPTTPVAPPPVAAAISLSASATSVASDNSTSTTITATVVDASNAAVSGVTVAFSADTGFLSTASAVSDASGKATVTFSSGTANPSSRTATITATASGKSTQIPIRISGSTLTLAATSSSLVVGGSAATLTVTAKNSAGAVLPGQAITLTQSGAGALTLNPSSGTTDASGNFASSVVPTAGGVVTVTASGVGETRTINFTITGTSTAFRITAPSADPAANGFTIGTAVPVSVSAPAPTTSVTFVTTLGTWENGRNVLTVSPVSGGTATAYLSSTSSGVANIQVFDTARQATINDSRIVSFTAACAAANKITLQPTPGVVAPSSGGTSSLATLVATVVDASNNPVGDCPIAFNIVNPTGGGETVSPAVVLTSSVVGSSGGLGQAKTFFTAGSLSSGAGGVQIRATVVRDPSLMLPTVSTSTPPSGSDATVVIGGTAGSVTIGRATVATSDPSGTLYILPMSILVADSNGNPMASTTVSLSAWPIAFNARSPSGVSGTSTTSGTSCSISASNDFLNEDDAFPSDLRYENLSLDPGEDGVRTNYWTGAAVLLGTIDGKLTPPNSAAGTLPATVVTDASGVATFNLTYTKSNALWIIDRIRAKTIVQGTETLGQIEFRLPALLSDIGPPCLVPDSPYLF